MQITNALREFESTTGYVVLFACEAGSRVWGIADKGSDYDIRFVYARPLRAYLSIVTGQDTATWTTGNFDFCGWDIRKALSLLARNNPSIHEWLRSPTIYLKDNQFAEAIQALAHHCWRPKASLYHYAHMATKHWDRYIRSAQIVRLKKYLYVVRAALCVRWIEDTSAFPPLDTNDLTTALPAIAPRFEFESLLALKKEGAAEVDVFNFPALRFFIEKEVARWKTAQWNRAATEYDDTTFAFSQLFYETVIRNSLKDGLYYDLTD